MDSRLSRVDGGVHTTPGRVGKEEATCRLSTV
jgi:hypothetical protein